MNDDISHECWCQIHDVTSAIKIRIDKVITEYKKKNLKKFIQLFLLKGFNCLLSQTRLSLPLGYS